MAKDTFYNLPSEKKRRIQDAAINEFAEFGYDKATIDGIVKKSGISKGSFYQYFSDKKDLFFYITFEVIKEKKMAYMLPILQNVEELDFFTLLGDLLLEGFKFARDYPELEKIGAWFMKNPEHVIFKEIVKESSQTTSSIYTTLLEAGKKRGEIREDIDSAYISYIITGLMVNTMEYAFKVNNIESYSDNSDQIMKTLSIMIDTLRTGIGKK